ncbi:MAG: bifunctional methylenetetrahydrofolate dehydrogenase/methenyltetrahydrofolate cyclohydrolase FolD [Abditibacteriales bacterium]|nr:bifunctional methylenetetrahydrofolate dehydrogenase/methenyltetrahydrofolate cyclohydrolase FolD [Abditibacteriales bacterium]MDW8367857.1 bifunctional methylenetetrahydrofolate dehydrogenase/methenyltetrahydrofolate cyclohydrolase FolD [Abditibacteriales bacterium]
MPARILDGTALAAEIRATIKQQVEHLKAACGITPGLATVLVGDDPASHAYVRSKRKACTEVGMESFAHELPATATQEEVVALVTRLNADPRVHGVLVQLPLPHGLDAEGVLGAVSLDKDVDGFHPLNIGRLCMKGREPLFVPCTPLGVIVLLEKAGAPLRGARAVVIGRSNIVGLPVAMLLLHRDCTVTICHSRTENLPAVCRSADILVAAVGRAEMVRGDWVKPGAFVIDVGINRVADATRQTGYRLVGDVAFDEVKEVAAALTPVPGGVGPMTIAMLLHNTLEAAKRYASRGGSAP